MRDRARRAPAAVGLRGALTILPGITSRLSR